jgi:hypothetical protein
VPSDPDFLRTRAFQEVFGAGEFALLLAEADDPFAPAVLQRIDGLERSLGTLPQVSANSALSIFRRARPDFAATEAFRAFATGTDLLRRQGLVGDGTLAVALTLDVHDPGERAAVLDVIDRAIAQATAPPSPLRGVSRLGLPFVNGYLDETQRDAPRYFVFFALFVVVLNLFLYRSLRTLVAFMITLGVVLALSLAYIVLTGGRFTLVTPMVPMTLLVTATSTLVYLHSRYVQRPEGRSVEEHQLFALENKFAACTASIFATGVGFAALTVSSIRPIFEMGLWVAVGCAIVWVVSFTLFPALQRVLRTPTRVERADTENGLLERFATSLPRWSHRHRYALVAAALGLSAAGAAALFGLPGLVAPMRVQTDPVEYIQHDSSLYLDIQRLSNVIPGQSLTDIWLRGRMGDMSEPRVLDGLHAFEQALAADPEVGAAVGPTTLLRLTRYLGGQGDAWPESVEEQEAIAADLEGMVGLEPMLARFVQPHELAQAHVTVISRATSGDGSRRRGDRTPPPPCGAPRARRDRARDGRSRTAPREDVAQPRPDAGRELRAHRDRHLRHLPRDLPQRDRAAHGDDPGGPPSPAREGWPQRVASKSPGHSSGSGTAGAAGGARLGSSRQSRIAWVTSGGWMVARSRIGPPQRGHSSTSTAKTRRRSSAQASRRGRRAGSSDAGRGSSGPAAA